MFITREVQSADVDSTVYRLRSAAVWWSTDYIRGKLHVQMKCTSVVNFIAHILLQVHLSNVIEPCGFSIFFYWGIMHRFWKTLAKW